MNYVLQYSGNVTMPCCFSCLVSVSVSGGVGEIGIFIDLATASGVAGRAVPRGRVLRLGMYDRAVLDFRTVRTMTDHQKRG